MDTHDMPAPMRWLVIGVASPILVLLLLATFPVFFLGWLVEQIWPGAFDQFIKDDPKTKPPGAPPLPPPPPPKK